MPKRSNLFQKLVYLIKQHANADAVVTESKMLLHNVTGEEREVDICIESTIGDDDVVICVECTSRTRPADVGWIEQMMKKHEHLQTHKLILASSSGFTADALVLAKHYGIYTVSLDDLDDETAAQLFSESTSLWSKTLTLKPTKVVVRVSRPDGLPSQDVVVITDNLIHTITGEEVDTVKELVGYLLSNKPAQQEFIRRGDPSHKFFELGWDPIVDKDAKPIFTLKQLKPEVLHPIESVKITGTCDFEVSEFELRRAKFGKVAVAWGTGLVSGMDALMVTSGRKLSIRFGDPGTDIPKRSKRRKRRKSQ